MSLAVGVRRTFTVRMFLSTVDLIFRHLMRDIRCDIQVSYASICEAALVASTARLSKKKNSKFVPSDVLQEVGEIAVGSS